MQNENVSKRKIVYILLALFLASILWFYVDRFGNNGSYEPTQVTINDIPVTYNGINTLADRGLMLEENQTTQTLDVTVEGSRVMVSLLDREDIYITANLSDVDVAGLQRIDYQVIFKDPRFSRDMIRKTSVDRATVNICELNSKIVDVICELTGNVADDYLAGELQLSQKTVEVLGEPEDIDRISYAKVVLDIGENAIETVSKRLELQYFDAHDQEVSAENIHTMTEVVQATLPVYVTKELKLVVDFAEAPGARAANLRYEIKPSTILVSGDASVLNRVDSITLGTFDLMELVTGGASSHTYPIMIPGGCENLSGVTRATMDIRFKDMVSAYVPTTMFTHTGISENKQVDVLTEQLSVRIFGTQQDVEAVTGDQITVMANLTGYANASGTYTVPGIIEIAALGDVGVLGEYRVKVDISDRTEEPPGDPGTTQPGTQTPEAPAQ